MSLIQRQCPSGEGARPVAGNVQAPQLVIARRMFLPLLRGEGRVRGNGYPELEVGSAKFHATSKPRQWVRSSEAVNCGMPPPSSRSMAVAKLLLFVAILWLTDRLFRLNMKLVYHISVNY